MVFTGIPIPPSLNNAYPTGRNGVRYKSKELVQWERSFDLWAFTHAIMIGDARKRFGALQPGTVIYIGCHFFFPRRQIITIKGTAKRNDTSNRLKHLHDRIADLLWIDDGIFFDGSFSKRPASSDIGYCNVELKSVEAPWLCRQN